jgi:hypothetical protein
LRKKRKKGRQLLQTHLLLDKIELEKRAQTTKIREIKKKKPVVINHLLQRKNKLNLL